MRYLQGRLTVICALSGLLLACSFPIPDFPLLAWFGLMPMLLTMSRQPFKSGFVSGLFFFAASLYWVNIVMTTYGHLNVALSILLYLSLSAALAFYWGVATWAACRLKEFRNYPFTMTLPVLWVALEFLREFLLTGFPWATLGYSQHSLLPMIQSADLVGVYGLSYLIVMFNCVIASIVQAVKSKNLNLFPYRAAAAVLVLLAVNFVYGLWSLQEPLDERTQTMRVGLIQGNIPQELKWLPEHQLNTVDVYRDLSVQAEQAGAKDLLIWPEAAMPFYFQEGGPLAESVRKFPMETGVSLLFGSPAYQRDAEKYRYLNSAYLLSPDGTVAGRSDKKHLVPFGEYVPLGSMLPFVDKLVVGIGDFSPGEVTPLPVYNHMLGVLVCYEVIFPELARDYVRQGSDLLVNITNDAWFGRSSAPWQHLAMARFRAVENRVWLVRAANTGVSALIAPSGKILQQTGLFNAGFLAGEVGLGAKPKVYTRLGDMIPSLFIFISLLWVLQTRRRLPQ